MWRGLLDAIQFGGTLILIAVLFSMVAGWFT